MAKFTKQEILDVIRKAAGENGGKPPGEKKLLKEFGISTNHWMKYWPKLSDAQKEAGFEPNLPYVAYDDKVLIEKMIPLIRKHKKYPSIGMLSVEANKNPNFPFNAIKKRKKEFVLKIIEYCKNKPDYDDILNICKPRIEEFEKKEMFESTKSDRTIGEVYLYKAGSYYKIGKTNNLVRRGAEIRLQVPELKLVHSIKTDDPSGIEAYWHNRFKEKIAPGTTEFFKLNSNDIKAFKQMKC